MGLRGRVKVSVIDHAGQTVLERPWQPNLMLEQGMDKLGADMGFADLFLWGVAGTDTTHPAKETIDVSNTYTLSGSVLTRAAGTRDFTADDVGALIRRADTPFTECIVTSIIGVTSVNVRSVGQTSLANYTTKNILYFHIQDTGLYNPSSIPRTDTYGTDTDDNKTTDVDNVRTLRRTFIFNPVDEQLETPAGTNTYSRSGTTVTKTAGARIFTAADIGKYIYFITADTLTKITAYTSGTQVTVADSGTVAAQNIKFYGFLSIGEIGFSDIQLSNPNLNIRVRLEDGSGNSDPVDVDGSNPSFPGQQLKIVYELAITVTPNTSTAGTAAITDSGNNMSANKTGHYCVEKMALSRVDADGATNLDYATLDPGAVGFMALSPSSAAIAPLDGPDRSAGAVAATLAIERPVYVAGSYTRLYEGTFGLVEANESNWRTMGLYDVDSETFPFVFLFTAAQTKDSDHVLTLRWRKTWNRDLS
jgi:hypothetical protein